MPELTIPDAAVRAYADAYEAAPPGATQSEPIRAGLAAALPHLVPVAALRALFAFWDCWHNEVGLCDPGPSLANGSVASLLMLDDAHRLDDLSSVVENFETALRALLAQPEETTTDALRAGKRAPVAHSPWCENVAAGADQAVTGG